MVWDDTMIGAHHDGTTMIERVDAVMIRSSRCKHPDLSDETLRTYMNRDLYDGNSPPYCNDCNNWCFPRINTDGDVILHDAPYGDGM